MQHVMPMLQVRRGNCTIILVVYYSYTIYCYTDCINAIDTMMSTALSLLSLPYCRSEGASEGTMVVLLFTPVQAGQHLVVHVGYTASLASGLARSAAFDYTDPVTGQLQSQVCLLAIHSRP